MNTLKQEALTAITQLPETVDVDTIMYRLEEYPGCGLKFWHHASPLRFDLSGTKNSRHLAAGKCLLKIDF